MKVEGRTLGQGTSTVHANDLRVKIRVIKSQINKVTEDYKEINLHSTSFPYIQIFYSISLFIKGVTTTLDNVFSNQIQHQVTLKNRGELALKIKPTKMLS